MAAGAVVDPRAEKVAAVAPAPTPTPVSPAPLATAKSALLGSMAYLNADRRREAFAASGADRPELVEQAVRVLAQAYPAEVSEEFATQKVLALQVLALSQYTRPGDCRETLFNVADMFDRAPDNDRRGVTGADLRAVARLCATRDPGLVQMMSEALRGRASAGVLAQL